MHFTMFPADVLKRTGVVSGSLRQSFSFYATIHTGDRPHRQSGLSDGRKIDAISCYVSIEASDSNDVGGFLDFHPERTSTDREFPSSPAWLALQVSLPSALFRALWEATEDDAKLAFLGEVMGIAPETDSSYAPYRWDVTEGKKPLHAFQFARRIRTSGSTSALEMEEVTEAAEASEARRSAEERHNSFGQMYLLTMKAVAEAEAEGKLRGLSKLQTEGLADKAATLIDDAYTAVRNGWSDGKEIDGTRLWVHQKLDETLIDGRAALKHWEVDKLALTNIARRMMDLPWLRVDGFEWAIVDALTFRESFEFGEHVKKPSNSFADLWAYSAAEGNLRKLPWQRLKAHAVSWIFRLGLFASGMWAALTYITKGEYSDWGSARSLGGTFLLLFFLLIGLPFGRNARKAHKRAQTALLQKMSDAYSTLRQDELLSPNQIRSALLSAQDCGAVWDPAALAILDRAAQRNPPVWML